MLTAFALGNRSGPVLVNPTTCSAHCRNRMATLRLFTPLAHPIFDAVFHAPHSIADLSQARSDVSGLRQSNGTTRPSHPADLKLHVENSRRRRDSTLTWSTEVGTILGAAHRKVSLIVAAQSRSDIKCYRWNFLPKKALIF